MSGSEYQYCATNAQSLTALSAQYELPEPPTDVISAVKYAPSSPERLLVSSWDRHVYLYETTSQDSAALLLRVEHRAPVLDICFGETDNDAFSAGLDWDVSHINLETGKKTVLSSHNAGVKSVVYSDKHKLLISASWDSELHIHPFADGKPTHAWTSISLPSKPFSVSATGSKLVVAMASRAVHIYDLAALRMMSNQSDAAPETGGQNKLAIEPWQTRESSLKFMTRAVACMPSDEGYAISSIEGRIGVDWFNPSDESQARKYAFKCHRQTEDDVDVVYPVNALAFHPVRTTTFASGGGDATVVFWDGQSKRRIKQYAGFPASISSMSWSSDGRHLAIGVSPGFEDGKEELEEGSVKVFVREISEAEVKGKATK